MNTSNQLVVFALDDNRYALRLPVVERTVRMVAVTPLPRAPEIVTGVVNISGKIMPVLDIRRRFRLPERCAGLGDQLIIARTSRRTVALVVDEVLGVIECPPDQPVEPADIVPGMEQVAGVVKRDDGMIFIHDLDQFLSLEEEAELGVALSRSEA